MARSVLGPSPGYGRLISEVFHPMELSPHPSEDAVRARFVSRGDDWLRATRGRVEHRAPIAGRRSSRSIAEGTRDEYLLITPLSGAIHYAQFGRAATVDTGTMVLLDARAPYEFERRAAGTMVCHQLRGEILREALHDPAELCVAAIRRDSGIGGALFGLLDSAWRDVPTLLPAERRALARAIGALLGAVGGAGAPAAHRGMPPYRRALDHIARHLDDPALNAATVAEAVGVSVSHLHAVMQRRGTSVGRTILEMRLDRCAEALRGPGGGDLRIGDLGYRWGLSDPAHFSRAFRARFGCPPRAYRDGIAH